MLFRSNIRLFGHVPTTLVDTEAPLVPSNFLADFTVPLLCTSLGRRRHSNEERDRFLDLVIRGMDRDKKHMLRAAPVSIPDGIIPCVVKR